jgi:hypothetical protein
MELFDYCMPKDDINAVILILFDPLISLILSGSNKISQTGAAVCLSDLIEHLGKEKELNKPILECVDVKVLYMLSVNLT